MSELLPCPFCGGKAWERDDGFGKSRIECDDCQIGQLDYIYFDEAAEAWNRRAARSTVPEAGKAVVWLPDPIGVNEIWQTVYDSLDLSEDLRTECADEISRAIAKTFSSPASVPAPSGAEPKLDTRILPETQAALAAIDENIRSAAMRASTTFFGATQAVPAEDVASEPKFLESLSREALADLLREEFRESARRAEKILDLRRKLEEAKRALEPFGRIAVSENWSDGDMVSARLAVGDFRRARALSGASE